MTAGLLLLRIVASLSGAAGAGGNAQTAAPAGDAPVEYRIDAKTSRLTVETETVGLASMFGHDHKFDARDFGGRITLVPGRPESAALALDVRGEGLILVEDVSDDTHREISAALRDVVLETGKYPEIAFRSRSISATRNDDGSFDVRLTGELALHGVKRKVTVPAHVTMAPGGLRATGALELRQSDFRIKPFTFAKATVKVRDTVAISFDLLARK
jgi:polyisoprenoid-binding protein YceI